MTRSSVRKSLKVVNLAGNDIEKIDAKFWLNTNLEEVNLSENKEIILNHSIQRSIADRYRSCRLNHTFLAWPVGSLATKV